MNKPWLPVMLGLAVAMPAGRAAPIQPATGRPDVPALHRFRPRHGSCRATNPIEHGLCVVRRVQAEVGNHSAIEVTLAGDPAGQAALEAAAATVDSRPESFVVLPAGRRTTLVVGRDATGAMYGLLEVAERLQRFGAGSLPLRE